jgi:RNA polymerase sigma factor (sigma-70 family)
MNAPADVTRLDDLELASQAREGHQVAVAELWTRHHRAVLDTARRMARQDRDAQELASDVFSGLLAALASGGGPTGSVRAYLVASVRHAAAGRARHPGRNDVLVDDHAAFERASATDGDPVAVASELRLVREAFATLPRRWQQVLWRTAVDHESNGAVADQLGLTPNAVAALAHRARQGLRVAYVQVHASRGAVDPGCAPYVGQLAALLGKGSRAGDVAAHVAECEACTGRLAELAQIPSRPHPASTWSPRGPHPRRPRPHPRPSQRPDRQ